MVEWGRAFLHTTAGWSRAFWFALAAGTAPLLGPSKGLPIGTPEGSARAQPGAVHCPSGPDIAGPTAPNFCADLVPTADLDEVTGTIELGPVATPFGVAVTADGRYRYRLTTTISGLPEPSTLGAFKTYVAWATTLSLDSVVKLGEVANGQTRLSELDYPEFRILISAETSAAVSSRSHRLVLRGTSPSTKLLAHRDLTQPFAPGLALGPSGGAAPGASGQDAMGQQSAMPGSAGSAVSGAAGGSVSWPLPPMTADQPMSPAMNALRPQVSPWLPGAGIDPATLSGTRPRETLHFRSGDTLTLTAGLVRRTVDGRTFVGYAYNGQIPGPLLMVPQGATLIVRYRNETDRPTSVHWHGVRVENEYDGADGVTQDPVPPGGRFTYHVHFRDAGIYWYHDHDREDLAQPLGLFGNILVSPAATHAVAPANQVEVVAVGDILLNDAGPEPWGASAPTNALMGRFGNVFLANGEAGRAWTVPQGSVVRYYLTNVSTARSYNLSFDGARMKVVGSDAGRFPRESWVSSIVIAPAERYIVDVRFPALGVVPLVNRVIALSHMTGTLFPEVDTIATVRVGSQRAQPDYSEAFSQLRADPDAGGEIERYRSQFKRPVDRVLQLQMRLEDLPPVTASMLTGVSVPVDWNDGMGMMNWATTPHQVTWQLVDAQTGRQNMDLNWHFRQGDVVKIRISNDALMPHAMDHVIHLHGQRFLVLSSNGLTNQDLVWKDTVLIPAGATVDLLLDLANPGRWLVHCHIAEHMEAGMMGTFTVDPRRDGSIAPAVVPGR